MFVKENNAEFVLPKSPEDIKDDAAVQKSLEDLEILSKIPLINYTSLDKFKDYTIVRFRGMIQDMLDPEIYLERYEVKKADGAKCIKDGKYRDVLLLENGEEVNYDSAENIQGERRTLFVVSIPALNEWAKTYEETCNQQNVPSPPAFLSSSCNGAKKRSATDENEAMETDCVNENPNEQTASNDNKKRQKVEETNNEQSCSKTKTAVLGKEYLLNSPIPERPGKACMIKIYKDFDSYSLNSIVDVVGFLSVDPSLDSTSMEVEFNNVSELQAQHPPPSLIPRLHAIAVHKLSHANPLLDVRFYNSSSNVQDKSQDEQMNTLSVQKDLRMLLTLCLMNDDLAADYLLSHLISTIYTRSEMENIGKFSLNICNLPKQVLADYTKKLYEILELLIPASHCLPLTLETMNTAAFVPK